MSFSNSFWQRNGFKLHNRKYNNKIQTHIMRWIGNKCYLCKNLTVKSWKFSQTSAERWKFSNYSQWLQRMFEAEHDAVTNTATRAQTPTHLNDSAQTGRKTLVMWSKPSRNYLATASRNNHQATRGRKGEQKRSGAGQRSKGEMEEKTRGEQIHVENEDGEIDRRRTWKRGEKEKEIEAETSQKQER